jgi:hypothetical protein
MFYYLLETIFYVWLLYTFSKMTFEQWLKYRRADFIKNIDWITLEIKLPREITKSPAAMESVLEAFQQGGGISTWWDKYRKGNLLNWFSLEIASFGGDIHFYIRTNSKFKNLIESFIYAQYPGVEIFEVEDYTNRIRYDAADINLMGSNFVLDKEDFYPIKTYVDYGLDKNPDEEFKIDPLTPMLEFFGSLKGGEEVWYQILIRSDKNKDWKKEATDSVAKMMMRKDPKDAEAAKVFTEAKLTQGEKDIIKAIERSTTKQGFEVFMRGIYLAPKDEFDGKKISSFMTMLKPFGTANLNSFKPQDDTTFNFPWQDNKAGSKLIHKKQYMFKKYVLRTFGEYYDQFDSFSLGYEINHNVEYLLRHGLNFSKWKHGKSSFILNAEELATLYHFPGKVVGTPTFKRISSTKSEAPNNLPI